MHDSMNEMGMAYPCSECECLPKVRESYCNCQYIAYLECPKCGKRTAISYATEQEQATYNALSDWNEENKPDLYIKKNGKFIKIDGIDIEKFH